MQEQIDIQLHGAFKQRHELMVVELRLEQVVERDLGGRSGDLDAAHAALEEEHADDIRRDGEVDLVVGPL